MTLIPMKIDQFEDIIAWQKSRDLTVTLYRIFKNNRDFVFKDQIQRASISIMNNIAEGFERVSDASFRRFLFIAKPYLD
jgi:four helix bundle protein